MPHYIRLRPDRAPQALRLPAAPARRDLADPMPAAEAGLRRLQEGHGGHAQALSWQPAAVRLQGLGGRGVVGE